MSLPDDAALDRILALLQQRRAGQLGDRDALDGIDQVVAMTKREFKLPIGGAPPQAGRPHLRLVDTPAAQAPTPPKPKPEPEPEPPKSA